MWVQDELRCHPPALMKLLTDVDHIYAYAAERNLLSKWEKNVIFLVNSKKLQNEEQHLYPRRSVRSDT